MILIDLQKEIDKISHKILLDKLLAIDFSKNAIIWYVSYLAEPHFPVEVINRVSKVANISCGVLKGSILDLLLFLIEVIGIGQDLECDLCLYADDSCWLFQLKSVTVIKKKQSTKDFTNICDCFTGLHFGEDKTKSILFSPKCNLTTRRIRY